jgi:hypothetical protein
VLLAAAAVACFRSGRQKPRQIAAAAAALLGALLAMVGTATFLERAGRDPFLVASGPVRWVSIHDAPVAQFDVPFEIDDLRLSPHGRLVALQPTEEDSRRGEPQVLHVGLSDGALTRIEATDMAFIDDQRALVLAIRDGRAEVQDMRFGERPAIVWRRPIEDVRWGTIGFDSTARQWIITGWDRGGRLMRAAGVIGGGSEQRTTWSGRTVRGGYVEAVAMRGTDAFVIERQYSFGPLTGVAFRTLLPFVARAHHLTQMWRLRGAERIDQGHSVLEASCSSDVLDEGRIACSAFDGTRTRFVAVDPATGDVAALAMMDERFVGSGASGGWMTGWTGSRATAVRLASRVAIRAPAADDEWIEKVSASAAVIGTVASIDGGSRVRIYALPETPPPPASTRASR